jgi:hypothetical protein
MHKGSNRALCWKCHVFYFCGLRMTVLQTEGITQLYGLRNHHHVARCVDTAYNSHMGRAMSQKESTLPLFTIRRHLPSFAVSPRLAPVEVGVGQPSCRNVSPSNSSSIRGRMRLHSVPDEILRGTSEGMEATEGKCGQ